MEEPSEKGIWEIDYTVVDLNVPDNLAHHASEEIQLVQNSNRVQSFFLVDPYTGFILPYRLSYEEEEMKSDQ